MIKEIIEREWEFFQKVQNIGGRASCQDDFETFNIQRTAQFKVFYQDVLESYLNDLKYYKNIGRNPVEEKYARMMESNDPLNYNKDISFKRNSWLLLRKVNYVKKYKNNQW